MGGLERGSRPLPLDIGGGCAAAAGRSDGSCSSSIDEDSRMEYGAKLCDSRSGSGRRSGSDTEKKQFLKIYLFNLFKHFSSILYSKKLAYTHKTRYERYATGD